MATCGIARAPPFCLGVSLPLFFKWEFLVCVDLHSPLSGLGTEVPPAHSAPLPHQVVNSPTETDNTDGWLRRGLNTFRRMTPRDRTPSDENRAAADCDWVVESGRPFGEWLVEAVVRGLAPAAHECVLPSSAPHRGLACGTRHATSGQRPRAPRSPPPVLRPRPRTHPRAGAVESLLHLSIHPLAQAPQAHPVVRLFVFCCWVFFFLSPPPCGPSAPHCSLTYPLPPAFPDTPRLPRPVCPIIANMHGGGAPWGHPPTSGGATRACPAGESDGVAFPAPPPAPQPTVRLPPRCTRWARLWPGQQRHSVCPGFAHPPPTHTLSCRVPRERAPPRSHLRRPLTRRHRQRPQRSVSPPLPPPPPA